MPAFEIYNLRFSQIRGNLNLKEPDFTSREIKKNRTELDYQKATIIHIKKIFAKKNPFRYVPALSDNSSHTRNTK